MLRSARRRAALGCAALLVLTGCQTGSPEPGPTADNTATTDVAPPPSPSADDDPSASVTPAPELGVPYDAPEDVDRVLPDGVGSLTSPEGHELTLVGVHPLAPDRVVVTGLLTLDPGVGSDFAINGFEEPELRRATAGGSEFAPFELRAPGDGATYLPVRDAEERCLCSTIRSGFQDGGDTFTVMTVMSAPADLATVDLDVVGFGTFDGVAVTELVDSDTTPWGASEVLAVRSAERAGGTVTMRLTLASPERATGWGYGVYGSTSDQLCLAGVSVAGRSAQAGLVEGCVRGVLPPEGQAVDLEVTTPDPGGEDLVVLPSNGLPLVVAVEGEAATGDGEELVTYESRSRTEGALVAKGEQVEVVLDTSVLFDYSESVLTPAAQATLTVAADALTEQDGRTLTIAGHTDSQGGAEYNMGLSIARATAVRDALAASLGEGWTFDVVGYGLERPLAQETGTPEEVEAAQARNRRVEITVAP